MKISDEVRERVKPISPLDDDELLALFRKHDARFRQLHEMIRNSDTNLGDRDMCGARVYVVSKMEESAMITRACAELIQIRLRRKPKKQ